MLKIGDKKLINAWSFYDWANSVYSLVISTAIFPLYFGAIIKGQKATFLGTEWEHLTSLYSYALSFSFVIFVFDRCLYFTDFIRHCRLYRKQKEIHAVFLLYGVCICYVFVLF